MEAIRRLAKRLPRAALPTLPGERRQHSSHASPRYGAQPSDLRTGTFLWKADKSQISKKLRRVGRRPLFS
jgi:hypothetical protein